MRLFRRPDAVAPRDDPPLIDAGWATATGRRPDNQDRVAVSPTWAILSDGAGGHAGGALAAKLAVDAAVARFDASPDRVDDRVVDLAVTEANAAVRTGRAADREVASMVATLTLAAALSIGRSHSTWRVVNVGDSPAWLVASGRLHGVSREDNLAAEMVRVGAISRDDARRHPGRHVITKAVGADDVVDASAATVVLRPGDALVLASDGLDGLDDTAMLEIISEAPSAAQAARRLVDAALAGGATDNVTVAIVRHRHEEADGGDGAPGGGAP